MNWKELVKPVIKFALKFGLDYGLERSAAAVAKHPEKGEQISTDIASLGTLIQDDAKAIGDGKYDEVEKAASDAKIDKLVDRIFEY